MFKGFSILSFQGPNGINMNKLDKRLPKNATDKIGDQPSITSVDGDVKMYFYFYL
jgi:hypothetical protein